MTKNADKRCFDDSTGNALKDGYTATGARRPITRKPGDILPKEDADRVDEFEERWGAGGVSSPWFPSDE